jgi:hypothetical protein
MMIVGTIVVLFVTFGALALLVALPDPVERPRLDVVGPVAREDSARAETPAPRPAPILSRDPWFTPDDMDTVSGAFAAALTKLGLNDRADPMVEMVGRRIIRAALNGERDPAALQEIGVNGAGGMTA